METTQQTKQVETALKNEAAKNKVFNDLCAVLAFRQRSRETLSVNALATYTKKHGFIYSKAEYQSVLKTLALMGIGTVDYTNRGRMIGLKNIKMNLQDIGKTALSGPATTSPRVPALPATVPWPTLVPESKKPSKPVCKVTVVIDIGSGKPLSIEVPGGIPEEQLGEFIASIYTQAGGV